MIQCTRNHPSAWNTNCNSYALIFLRCAEDIDADGESAFKKLKRAAEIAENKAKIMNNKDKAAAYDEEYGKSSSEKDAGKAKTESGSDSKPKNDAKPKADTKPKAETKSESKPKAETKTETASKGESYVNKVTSSNTLDKPSSSIAGNTAFVRDGKQFIDITDLMNK